MEPAAYIRRETRVSIAINAALSAAFFAALFGFDGPVPVWGAGGFVADFAPQGFMVGLMATVVPGLLARRARATGRLAGLSGSAPSPAPIALRAVLCGVIGAGAGVAMAALALGAGGQAALAWFPALVAKIGFGAILAGLATPAGLRAELMARRTGEGS